MRPIQPEPPSIYCHKPPYPWPDTRPIPEPNIKWTDKEWLEWANRILEQDKIKKETQNAVYH